MNGTELTQLFQSFRDLMSQYLRLNCLAEEWDQAPRAEERPAQYGSEIANAMKEWPQSNAGMAQLFGLVVAPHEQTQALMRAYAKAVVPAALIHAMVREGFHSDKTARLISTLKLHYRCEEAFSDLLRCLLFDGAMGILALMADLEPRLPAPLDAAQRPYRTSLKARLEGQEAIFAWLREEKKRDSNFSRKNALLADLMASDAVSEQLQRMDPAEWLSVAQQLYERVGSTTH